MISIWYEEYFGLALYHHDIGELEDCGGTCEVSQSRLKRDGWVWIGVLQIFERRTGRFVSASLQTSSTVKVRDGWRVVSLFLEDL